MRLLVGVLLMVAAGSWGCTKPNPAYCSDSSTCANGTSCDLDKHECTASSVDAGSSSCTVNSECSDTSKPVCGTDGACRACALDDECDSGICRSDGACELESNVLYVSTSGVAAGQCSKAAPCELFYARSQLSSTRSAIRLGNGTYALATIFSVAPPLTSVTVAGGHGAVVQRSTSGFAFEVRSGAHLTVRGLTFNRGIECNTSASLDVQNLVFDASTETRSWLLLSSCTTSVANSELLGSSALGIDAKDSGKLDVIGSSIKRSTDDGLRAAINQLSVVRSSIELNSGMGIRATTMQAVIRRSWVHMNTLGGIKVFGGFDVTNNFVIRNGSDAVTTDFGGLRLESQVTGNRVDHNTVVQNTTIPQSTFAGGLYCTGGAATNNLIADNVVGNEQAGNAQFAGTCPSTGSLIAEEVTAFHLVEPFNDPIDFHLGDAQSIAVDAGTIVLPLTEDYDGDPRSDGKPDVGADEFTP